MLKICLVCGKDFTTKDKRRKYCSVSCYHTKASLFPNNGTFKKGFKPHNWKENGVKMCALHQWVYHHKGRPLKCIDCGTSSKKLQWSNIDHKYRRILDDYVARCSSCHKIYDNKMSGNIPWNKGITMGDIIKKKISISCKQTFISGRITWNKGKSNCSNSDSPSFL